MNSYELSRDFTDWCFENPHKVKPIHYAIFFFAVEHCNRLGWKTNFGFPSQMVMEAIGVKNWRTYSLGLNDLVEFGFIKMIEKSKNQYSSNIIAIVKKSKAPTKALDKALQKHGTKQGQGTVSIDKQLTKNKEQRFEQFWELYGKKGTRKKSLERWMKLTDDKMDKSFEVVEAYVLSTPDKKYRKGLESWIHNECWNDHYEEQKPQKKSVADLQYEHMMAQINKFGTDDTTQGT